MLSHKISVSETGWEVKYKRVLSSPNFAKKDKDDKDAFHLIFSCSMQIKNSRHCQEQVACLINLCPWQRDPCLCPRLN